MISADYTDDSMDEISKSSPFNDLSQALPPKKSNPLIRIQDDEALP